MTAPIYVVTLAEALPAHLKLVTDKLHELADLSRMSEGCLRFDIYCDTDQPCRFNTIELWATREDHQRHIDSPLLFKTISSLFGKMAGMPQVRVLSPISVLED